MTYVWIKTELIAVGRDEDGEVAGGWGVEPGVGSEFRRELEGRPREVENSNGGVG